MTLTDEEKEKYEKEFSDFLIERIKNLGGTLQFQYITSLLPQLSFEVQSAVGSSKHKLMKFLKSHPKKFKVDSKGVVTAIETSAVEDEHSSDNNYTMVPVKCSLPLTIQNGKGRISKLHSEFGFITALEPIETTVHFRAPQLSGDKDDLLAEYDLKIGSKVCFNAIMGHSDCDAKYRATKVWRHFKNSGDETVATSDFKQGNLNAKGNDIPAKFANNSGKKKIIEENLNGKGVIQKVLQHVGFISVAGRRNETVFFHIKDLEDFDDIDDLTKILKSGDGMEFIAARSSKKDSQAKWQAITVRKKSKKNKQKNEEKYITSDTEEMDNRSSKSQSGNKNPHSVINVNCKGSRKKMLKDQIGKISILPNGINITFGEKFTEIANANSSTCFFLYGAKVSDIPWEFSDGDEVSFDAVKIKAEPGWKAVLVWVGEKPDYVLPTCLGDFSEFTDEENQVPEEKSNSRSKNLKSSEKSVKTNTRSYNTEQTGKKKSFDHHDYSRQKFENKSDRDYRKQNLKQPQSGLPTNMSVRESNKHRQRKEPQIKDAAFNRFKGKQNPSSNRRVEHSEGHQNKLCSQNVSHQNLSISENSDNEIEDQDNELRTVSKFLSSLNKNEQFNRESINQPDEKTTFSESETDDSEHIEVSEYKKKNYGKSSIKKFQNIDGKITKVNCKFAFAKNPDLQETVNFFSNVFYDNGQSVEEQGVEDLREVISSGVTVKLNCFEIVDDFGKIHHKVTMAWLGEQPEISEISPDEFIEENRLSVNVKYESDDVAPAKSSPKKFLFAANNSDSEHEIEECSSRMKFSSSENASDDETSLSSKCSKMSENEKHRVFSKRTETSMDYKLLSEIVSQQLESRGLFYTDSEVNLNALSAEIVDVIVQRYHSTNESGTHSIKVHSTGDNHVGKSVCSHCAKRLNGTPFNQNSNFDNKEVQTIITGEIVSQSIFTEI